MIELFFLILFVLNIMLGIYRFKVLRFQSRLILFLVIFTLITEICNYFSAKYLGTNFPSIHIYTAVELLVLSIAYYYELKIVNKKGYFTMVIFYLLFCLGNAFFFQPAWTHLNSYAQLLESIFFTYLALLFFYQFIKGDNKYPLYQYSFFWINVGFLIYLIGNLLFSGLYNRYIENHEIAKGLFQWLSSSFNIFLYVCTMVSFYMPYHLTHEQS
jgi:hypothetical protein